MRINTKAVSAMALAGALTVGASLAAGATTTTTTPSTTSSTTTSSTTTTVASTTTTVKVGYWVARAAIARAYDKAVDKAWATYRKAIASPITPAQRAADRAAYYTALSTAWSTYATAIGAPSATTTSNAVAFAALEAAVAADLVTFNTEIQISATAKAAAWNTLQSSLATAESIRSAALTALGPPPTKKHGHGRI